MTESEEAFENEWVRLFEKICGNNPPKAERVFSHSDLKQVYFHVVNEHIMPLQEKLNYIQQKVDRYERLEKQNKLLNETVEYYENLLDGKDLGE